MNSDVNRIHNPDLSDGGAGPRGWVWSAKGRHVRWRRGVPGRPVDAGGMTILSHRSVGEAWWSQTAVCRPGKHYRIEATVTCDLVIDETAPINGSAGFALAVQPFVDDEPKGGRRVTPALVRASAPTAIRTYYKAPDDVRRLRVSVGVVDAAGTAGIHHVRLIEIIEPEATSHALAVPPPSHVVPAPRAVERVCVCSDTGADRPVTRLLRGHFGPSAVTVVLPDQFRAAEANGDALLLLDDTPPPAIRSLRGLLKLAAGRIVVISLPAMTTLAPGPLNLRRVEQDDDPIHAKVSYANHAARGFALHDVFPYAWCGGAIGSFVQNQFRRSEALDAFCEKHGFVTLLRSMCNQDVTSERPICLYKETDGGGLYVLDIQPCEADDLTFGGPTFRAATVRERFFPDGSTFAESALAVHFLLSVLGRTPGGLGQYTVPVETEAELRETIREMGVRFRPIVVHDPDVPIEEVTEQLVTVGREDESYSMPLAPKPVIVVRSGLSAGDVESVYGALLWFKQFVRMEPYVCPYAEPLASRFQLAWIPLAASWDSGGGWRRSGSPPSVETAIAPDHRPVAALIDVASCPTNEVGVVLPSREGVYERYATWLPRLAAAFGPGPYFVPGVDEGEPFADRDHYAWRSVQYTVRIVVDPAAFAAQAHREVRAAGGQVVRIEVPGNDADFAAHSMLRTDLAATLLEHVIGLQFGLIAVNRQPTVVNRQPTTVHFDQFSPIAPGEALIIDHRDPTFQADASQAG